MRILLDEEELPWEQAWNIVTNTFFFTNHTVLPVRGLAYLIDFPWTDKQFIAYRKPLRY